MPLKRPNGIRTRHLGFCLVLMTVVGCAPTDQGSEGKEGSQKGLWPQEPDSVQQFGERNFKKHMLGHKYLDSMEWVTGRELFDQHFKGIDSVHALELKIGIEGLRIAMGQAPKPSGSSAGIVFHYGLDTSATKDSMVYAISLVPMTLRLFGGEMALFEYDEKGTPFYTVSSAGSLQRPLPPDEKDEDRRKEWITKHTGAYFAQVNIQRHDTAQHVPVIRHFDPEQEGFLFLQLDHLASVNGATHVAVSSIVQHGFDKQGLGTDYAHAIALTAWKDGRHLIDTVAYNTNNTQVDFRRASDLGNICPPKCRKSAPFPAL